MYWLMRIRWLLVALLIALVLGSLVAVAHAASPTATPTVNLNLRSGPGTGYARIGTVFAGTPVSVEARDASGYWLLVDTDVRSGWLAAWLVELSVDKSTLPVANSSGVILQQSANAQATPSWLQPTNATGPFTPTNTGFTICLDPGHGGHDGGTVNATYGLVENGIVLTAYTPFARGRVPENDVLAEIGNRHDRTAAQVALRWLIQQPMVATIPKAATDAHLHENIDVFDFELSDGEMERIFDLQGGLLDRLRAALDL